MNKEKEEPSELQVFLMQAVVYIWGESSCWNAKLLGQLHIVA